MPHPALSSSLRRRAASALRRGAVGTAATAVLVVTGAAAAPAAALTTTTTPSPSATSTVTATSTATTTPAATTTAKATAGSTTTTTAPVLSIAVPTGLTVGRSASISATLARVPSGQSVRITLASVPGLTCAATERVDATTARTRCTFTPRAAGGYTMAATAVRSSSGKTVGTSTLSRRITVAAPALSLAVPSGLTVGRAATLSATLSGVPNGQTVSVTLASLPGMSCSATAWVAPGKARRTCVFTPRAVGGYTVAATGVRRVSGKVVGSLSRSRRVSVAPAPRLTITSPALSHVGSQVSATGTVTAVPAGQSVRISMSGLTCGSTTWVAKGTARATCGFRPTAGGAYTVRAQGALSLSGRSVGTTTASTRVTAMGVTAVVPDKVRRGEKTLLRFTIGAGWAPGTVVTLAPGVAGATGCPATITVRLSVERTATASCTVIPEPTKAMRVAPDVRAGVTGHMAGAVVSRAVLDGPALDAAAAEAAWRQQSQALWDLSLTKVDSSHDAASTGFEIMLRAHKSGWDDPTVATLVQRFLSLRNPDGGWGTGTAWDAFQDGTVNPADTSYTVSTAGHAGPALLGAWQHHLVTDADLRAAVDSLLTTPTWKVPGGLCIAYSRSANDTTACVSNVTLGAAAWLKQVREATGWSIPALDDLVAQVSAADRYLWDPSTGYWAYSDLPGSIDRPQDPPHQGYTLQSVLVLDPVLGKSATAQFLANPWWGQPSKGRLGDYGNGMSQVAFTDCTGAAASPALLEAFTAIQSYPADQMTRFLALQGTLYGFRTLGVCFTGETW